MHNLINSESIDQFTNEEKGANSLPEDKRNLLGPVNYRSSFDSSKRITEDNWVITQVALGRSTGVRCPLFEMGHSTLFIETVCNKEKRVYRFDYSNLPPDDLKHEVKGVNRKSAWLHKISYGDNKEDNLTYAFFTHKNKEFLKNLTESKKQAWEAKSSAVDKLLQEFNNEFLFQQIEKKPAKIYSFLWENCHFLISEKLSKEDYRQGLGINTCNISYMEKFHIGGWKYTIVLYFPVSMVFTTLIPTLHAAFLILEIEGSYYFNWFSSANSFAFPAILINFINNSVFLLSSLLTGMCSVGSRESWLDIFLNFISTSTFFISSLSFYRLISSLWSAEYRLFQEQHSIYLLLDGSISTLSATLFDIFLPLASALFSILLQAGIFFLLKGLSLSCINSQRSKMVNELMTLTREQRINKIREYIVIAFVPICVLISNSLVKNRCYNLDWFISDNIFLTSPLFYAAGCLFGQLCLMLISIRKPGYFSKYYSLKHFLRTMLIAAGAILPVYILVTNKIFSNDEFFRNWGHELWLCKYGEIQGPENPHCIESDRLSHQALIIANAPLVTAHDLLVLAGSSLGGFLTGNLLYFFLTNLFFLPSQLGTACNKASSAVKNGYAFLKRSFWRQADVANPNLLDNNQNRQSYGSFQTK